MTRRTLLRAATLGGFVAVSMPSHAQARGSGPRRPALADRGARTGGTLDPARIAKYATAVRVLPVMPPGEPVPGIDNYTIGVRQFRQQILPPGLPSTLVWGYGSTFDATTFHSPGFTIEARAGRPVRVTWVNQLVDGDGHFLPHLLPVDQTLHWANPAGGVSGRDSCPMFTTTPGAYTGPVPVVAHLHGAHCSEENDGYPSAWYLPAARDLPAGYATVGSFYDRHRAQAADRLAVNWLPGTAVCQYPNDQPASTLWYHDHTLGMTRVNVHAGLAGYYLIRGGDWDLPPGTLPEPAPRHGGLPDTRHHEIALVVQDRSFNRDGSIFFPAGRGFFGDTPPDATFIPVSDVPPIWNPESFGNTMVVNGRAWPVLAVEPRRYRFRFLNACNARTLILKIAHNPLAARPARSALPFWQIGSDGGFLRAPVQLAQLLCAPAERADVIVDFTGLTVGTELYLINEGPDMAFNGAADATPADPATTGQVMKFVVTPLTSPDTSVPPAHLTLPAPRPATASDHTWKISLNEMRSRSYPQAPATAMLGTVHADGTANPLRWGAPVTETPVVNATQTWEIANFTADAHPIHIHQVQFQITNRQPFGGSPRPPESWETGLKDTVIAYPNEFTRFTARFDIPGRYVLHCHILDHEDNEMMRPIQAVLARPSAAQTT
ncbi:multicopper oxidase family protein [Kutzneria albida]|nr:multicopper oxidase [Kutzneria albida]